MIVHSSLKKYILLFLYSYQYLIEKFKKRNFQNSKCEYYKSTGVIVNNYRVNIFLFPANARIHA